jgi:hypothetical protein
MIILRNMHPLQSSNASAKRLRYTRAFGELTRAQQVNRECVEAADAPYRSGPYGTKRPAMR